MRYIFTAFTALLFLSSFAQTPIKIKQIESFDSVIISYNATKGHIWGIQIPFEVEVCFNGNDSLWVSGTSTYIKEEFAGKGYGDGWKSSPLQIKIRDKYIIQYPSSRYSQQPDTCHYLIWARYNINPNSELQDSFAKYAKQMQIKGTTSLSIGTLSEFKAKHLKIVEHILKNDSIGFDIRKTPRKFIERASIPINY